MDIDKQEIQRLQTLDGCYTLKTNLTVQQADKQTVHSRYKDLAQVEKAFRYSKTTQLELRPIYVRKESSTRAHVFVVMLSYWILKHLSTCWKNIDCTVQEGLNLLQQTCLIDIKVNNKLAYCQIPQPREDLRPLLKAAKVILPETLAISESNADTRKKLRKSRKKFKKK